jgi:hypothetical protein
MPDPALAKAQAEALILTRQRLRTDLLKVCELAGRGNIPAARYLMDDAMSDLGEIQRLMDELDANEVPGE